MKLFSELSKNKNNKARIERENQNRQQLKNILSVARSIISKTTTYEEKHPVYLLIKQLVDNELNKNIYSCISTFDESKVKYFDIHDILPYNRNKSFNKFNVLDKSKENEYLYVDSLGKQIKYYEFIQESKVEGKSVTIKLGQDPVITRPWNVNRLIGAYSNIGKGKTSGNWQQDSNHRTELWLPFGITFVNSGNHSITTGILNNEGSLEVTEIYDMSNIFHHIYCDGVNFFRTKDNSLYASVENFSLAIVYEIGRLINSYKFSEKNIKFKNLELV
ncbi:hypothetical protein DFH04_10780 [Clostridium novyi]|uniref:DUF6710 family protein n=1 Tax=Clostridium novyi TaxID=1542 RepID=UPI000EA109A6|nr:DUF6710 family protein [Clostridium novyi]AYF55182.1 hypothetical protein DFH04_10780 [Clostridium novyi]